MRTDIPQSVRDSVSEEHAPNCHPAPKWIAIVNDQLFPMPERRVKAAAIREQAAVPKDGALLRDHNSESDVVMPDNGVIDLGEGNVFYTEPLRDVTPRSNCLEPAKLAYSVNDRWEIVIKPEQTGRTIRDLFKLPDDVELLRDFHSPHDETIGDEDSANFKDGPVFIARPIAITIKVNGHPVRFTKRIVTGLEIKRAAIAQGVPIKEDFALYPVKPNGELGAVIKDDDKVKLHECEEFRAVTTDDNS